MAHIEGFDDLSKQLAALGEAAGGNSLKASAMVGMLPALQAARAAIPVGDPPYHEGAGVKNFGGGISRYGFGSIKSVDPYPVKSRDGMRTPGFAKRSLRRKAKLSSDKMSVTVMVGVSTAAWYATQYVELGSSKMAKRPWLEPSFRSATPAVAAAFADDLRDRLDKAAAARRADQTDTGDEG